MVSRKTIIFLHTTTHTILTDATKKIYQGVIDQVLSGIAPGTFAFYCAIFYVLTAL